MTERITNRTVKAAMEAWQGKDLKAWLGFFTPDAKLLDDGNPRDFKEFSAEIGKERFTSIDKVGNNGLDIYGKFHSDRWGGFKTYFRFRLDAAGKFDRLEIGQANY